MATYEEKDYVNKRIDKIFGYINEAQNNPAAQPDPELDMYITELNTRANTDPEQQRQILAKIIRNPYITKPFIDRITQVGSDAGNKILYVIRKMFEEQIDNDPKLNLVIKEYVDDTPNRNNSLLHGYSVELEKKPYTADDEVQFLLRVLARSIQESLPNPNPNQPPNPDQPPYGTYTRNVALDLHKNPITAGGGRKKRGKSKRKHRKRSNAKKRGSKKTIKKH
jgi:hypothetical protein